MKTLSKRPVPQVVNAWRVNKDTMGGLEKGHFVYLDRDTANLVVQSKPRDEFVNWVIEPVKVRRLTRTEGAIGQDLVMISDVTFQAALRARALAKLTMVERKALGL